MKSVRERKWLAAAAVLALTGCTKATESATEPTPLARLAETPRPQSRIVTLPEGTVLKVRTTTAISTNTHQTGDTFVGTLHEPLIEGTRVVAPKGARVEGLVADANKGGRVKGVAEIAVRLTKLNFANGQVVDIATGSVGRRARTTKKSDATKIGIASGVGAAIGAIAGGGKGAAIGAATGAGAGGGLVLATRGEPAVIGGESVLTFKLSVPLTITAN